MYLRNTWCGKLWEGTHNGWVAPTAFPTAQAKQRTSVQLLRSAGAPLRAAEEAGEPLPDPGLPSSGTAAFCACGSFFFVVFFPSLNSVGTENVTWESHL